MNRHRPSVRMPRSSPRVKVRCSDRHVLTGYLLNQAEDLVADESREVERMKAVCFGNTGNMFHEIERDS